MGWVALTLSIVLALWAVETTCQEATTSSKSASCRHTMHSSGLLPYRWMTDESQRQLAMTSPGNMARLRSAMHRSLTGQNLTVVFLGGSITAGQGAEDATEASKPFPMWFEQIVQAAMGKGTVHVHNGAVPGTMSSYMSVCHNLHVPAEADIVVLDYTLNDEEIFPGKKKIDVMAHPARRAFERLIRKLLTYPKRPAVLLLHAYRWHRLPGDLPSGSYWPGCERDFHDFGLYYELPELSVKAAAWKLMRAGVPGFNVNSTRESGRGQDEADLIGKVFYWDILHPEGHTGHKFMGELAAQAILDALAGAKASPSTEEELASIDEQLPPPMLPGNWESASDKCFTGSALAGVVMDHEGWEYKDEGRHPTRPKLGWISEHPGTAISLRVNTTSSAAAKGTWGVVKRRDSGKVIVEIAFLKSFENMGQASVMCKSGCFCAPSKLDGNHSELSSQLFLHAFKASQHDECVIAITVLPDTSSGKHKVKICGIVISEEGGEGVVNGGAVDMANDGSNWAAKRSEGGTYELRQWASGMP